MPINRDFVLAANRRAYGKMVADGAALCQIVSDEELANPLRTVDSIGWLGGDIRGKNVLCLAGGGGRQSALYAAAGAQVTVVDLSPEMLELDRQTARQRGHRVQLIEGSIDDLSMLAAGEFDIVVQPVSSCYVPDLIAVYRQVARVLCPAGTYISQHKTPTSLQSTALPCPVDASQAANQGTASSGYLLEHQYYREEPIPPPPPGRVADRLREPGAVEFLHRWETLLGGLCRCGFVIEDLIEPLHAKRDAEPGSFAHRARFIPPYVRIKAKRISSAADRSSKEAPTPRQSLWLPDAGMTD